MMMLRSNLHNVELFLRTVLYISNCCIVVTTLHAFTTPTHTMIQMLKHPTTSLRSMHAERPDTTSCYYIGIDLGTSGARISIIEHEPIRMAEHQHQQNSHQSLTSYSEIYSHAVGWNDIVTMKESMGDKSSTSYTVKIGSYDEPHAWCGAVEYLFACATTTMEISKMQQVLAICISGTSSSCLLVCPNNTTTASDSTMDPSRGVTARMYNYGVKDEKVQQLLKQYVPDRHTAQSTTGTFAKLLSWHVEASIPENERLCHQADYIIHQWLQPTSPNDSFSICSDWHNCLKLGYDVQSLQWPKWLVDCLHSLGISESVLPRTVVSPGAVLGNIRPTMAAKFGLSERTMIVGGTTDSNAAFFAAIQDKTRVMEPGIAVTSLGSTVALKQLSTSYVEDATCGVYSHRFPSTFQHRNTTRENDDDNTALWLVGGASNVGCAILRHLNFSNNELNDLSQDIDPNTDSPYSYYPLMSVGERFPIADRNKEPNLDPIPTSRREYLHGLLQGISDVERDGYIALGALGVAPSIPNHIYTCGGGSRNDIWNRMRQRRLNDGFKIVDPTTATVVVQRANNVEASYGAAILAASSFS